MPDKTTFILRFLLFALVHSLLATACAKKIFRGSNRREYRLCYNVVSLSLLGWVLSACRHSNVLYVAPGVWSLVMYLLQLVVAVIIVYCLRQTGIGEFLGFVKSTHHRLATNGCYSIVRHPLYFFSTLFMALNPVMTSQWLLLTVMSAAYFTIGGWIEEKRLLEEFGDEYHCYQQRVPFLIPGLFSPGSHRQPIPDRLKS